MSEMTLRDRLYRYAMEHGDTTVYAGISMGIQIDEPIEETLEKIIMILMEEKINLREQMHDHITRGCKFIDRRFI